MKKILGIAFGVTLLFSCGDIRYKEEYYPSGELMYKVEIVDGKQNGESVYYYENGTIRQVGNWKNDLEHGIFKKYHSNGQIAEIYEAREGGLFGEAKGYYSNGKLEYEIIYENGVAEGESKYYYENGSIKEIKEHKNGKIWYLESYAKSGVKEYSQFLPYYDYITDTLVLGEEYKLRILFEILPEGQSTGYFGTPSEEGFSLVDTIQIFEVDKREVDLSFTPKKEGNIKVGCFFMQNKSEKDTIDLINVFPEHDFYVKNTQDVIL